MEFQLSYFFLFFFNLILFFTLHNCISFAKYQNESAVELFQILKDDAMKELHSICQQIGKLSSGHRTGKGQFSFQSQRRAVPKNAQINAQLHSSHMLAK